MASSARPARRYPTDLTSRQWRPVEPLLPAPPAGPAGRPRKHPPREIGNAILYHVRAGGAWRMLPRAFPPWQTVYWYFTLWRTDGTLDRLHHALREQTRAKRSGRQKKDPAPSAGSFFCRPERLARVCSRSAWCRRSSVPSVRQRVKYQYTVCQGGKALGSIRHAPPARTWYRIALTISRGGCLRGRPAGPAGGAGSSGSTGLHCRLVRSVG